MGFYIELGSRYTFGATVDNYVFRLHYRVTCFILIFCTALVGFAMYIGDPINCTSRADVRLGDLNKLCWLHTTFIELDNWDKEVGVEVPFRGVGIRTFGGKKHYPYYQWVCLSLLLQTISFYLPRYFWKKMEGGKMNNLVSGINSPALPDESKSSKKRLIVEYVVSNLKNHNFYFACYVYAELWNFSNVVGQIFLMNDFLGGEFLSNVSKVKNKMVEWNMPDRNDPMLKIFPRVTKCVYYNYGASGDVQLHEAMCMLPVNTLNEQIYIFLWSWFLALSVLSALALVYRAATFNPKFRSMITHTRVRIANQNDLEAIIKVCGIGDWLILDLLSRNLDELNYREIIGEIARSLGMKKVRNSDILSLTAIQDTAVV